MGAREGEADLDQTERFGMQKDRSPYRDASARGPAIGSNLQKRDRAARDEDGFVFLAPASAGSTSRAYAPGMCRINYRACVGLGGPVDV